MQFVATEDSGTESEDVCATQYGFSLCHVTTDKLSLRNLLLLDNQSTCNIFCNKKLVTRVWTIPESMTILGNGGSITTNQKAHVRNYGDVWFDKRAITNILSLKNVQKRYGVTYDSTFNRAFIVHKPEGSDLHFIMHQDKTAYTTMIPQKRRSPSCKS